MATSTNYGWAEPDNSSLVKNGASDIRTLGNAIDTSLWNSGFGQAGKNKIINGNMSVWQRGTSFTNNTSGDVYTADRWVSQVNGTGTRTISQQSFTAGTAPVAGYEGQYFLRMACSASGTATYFNIKQKIEDVRTFAGQTVTVSFWAKASAAFATSFFGLTQDFGSGGSTAVDTAGTNITFSTSWVRYTQTFSVPSVSGKTIGTSSNLALAISFGSATFTSFDIWGVQVEYGSVATPFQTASGSIQGELALCQRYYWRTSLTAYANAPIGVGMATSSTAAKVVIPFPVQMRSVNSIDYASLTVTDLVNYTVATTAVTIDTATNTNASITGTVASGLSQYRVAYLATNTANSGYIGFNGEL